jgi:tRNA nucleotidyltransferase (CCA-adding enzyme)
MATTIKQGFEQLKGNLEITDLQSETVSTRQQNVREAVEKELVVLDSFLTGSYRRNTMIAPLAEADIDIFVVLDASYFEQNGQAALLDKVKRVLKKTYPKTPDISRDGQAVTIAFSDFQVDVVPSFYRQGGGFLIPDSVMSRWISTDPKKHVQIWSDANQVHCGDQDD